MAPKVDNLRNLFLTRRQKCSISSSSCQRRCDPRKGIDNVSMQTAQMRSALIANDLSTGDSELHYTFRHFDPWSTRVINPSLNKRWWRPSIRHSLTPSCGNNAVSYGT